MQNRRHLFVILALISAILILSYFAFRPTVRARRANVLRVKSANAVVWSYASVGAVQTRDGSSLWMGQVEQLSADLAPGSSVEFFWGTPVSVDDAVVIRGKKYKGTPDRPLVLFITDEGAVKTDVPLPPPETLGTET